MGIRRTWLNLDIVHPRICYFSNEVTTPKKKEASHKFDELMESL
jgi:hypothetical protein